MTGKQLDELYTNKKLDTVTVIVTKKAALKAYQDKLSMFSRDYQDHLRSHNYKDDDIQYIVHNDPLEKKEVVNFLYELRPDKIISVTFVDNAAQNATNKKTVIIDLKVGE